MMKHFKFINGNFLRISSKVRLLSVQSNVLQNSSSKFSLQKKYFEDPRIKIFFNKYCAYKRNFAKFAVLTFAFLFSYLNVNANCDDIKTANEASKTCESIKKPSLKTDESSHIEKKSSVEEKRAKIESNKQSTNSNDKNDLNQSVKIEKKHLKKDSLENSPPREDFTENEKENTFPSNETSITLKVAQNLARNWLSLKLEELGIPGLTIAVSIDGKIVFAQGLGFCDVENRVRCVPQSVMRIASISKPLTAVAAFQLVEEGKLDLDAPIQKYLPDYPIKKFSNKEVFITTRQLLSHTAGIRHYNLKDENHQNVKNNLIKRDVCQEANDDSVSTKRKAIRDLLFDLAYPEEKKIKKRPLKEFDMEEYYIKEKFENVKQALELFKDDDLLFEPGKGYSYSTHGYTLLSAVIEGASGKKFDKIMKQLFHDLGLNQTLLEDDHSIIYNRSRYYIHNKAGNLKNAPYVNNSYKYAGGGILSSVLNLNKFGNAILYSYQYDKSGDPANGRGFLKSTTVSEMWTPIPGTESKKSLDGAKYGLGWMVFEAPKGRSNTPFCRKRMFMATHSGGAIGASSYFVILPMGPKQNHLDDCPPRGVVVAILCNMQSADLARIAKAVAEVFAKVEDQSKVLGTISGSKAQIYNVDHS